MVGPTGKTRFFCRHAWPVHVHCTLQQFLFVIFFSLSCMGTVGVGGDSLLGLGDKRASPTHVYASPAAINIGAVFSILLSQNESCSNRLRESGVVQYVEAIVFAISEINKSPDLLPKVDLGFVIMDDCMKPLNALAQTLHFFPVDERPNGGCEERCVQSSAAGMRSPHSFYDVVGVVGAENSPASMIMANVLNIFQIPQISPASTSDLLSDKSNYPYFMRMMPPDKLQVQAILDLVLHFNWTYISMVYSKGGYGEEAVKHLKQLAGQEGVCTGAMLDLPEYSNEGHFNKVVTDLHEQNARVVVLFVDQEVARGVFLATKRKNMIGRFVWIGSDGLGVNTDDFDGVEDAVLGTLTLRPYSGRDHKFEEYFESLTLSSNSQNPWLSQMWERLFECEWGQNCNANAKITDSRDYAPEAIVGNIIDSIYTFAHALHALIEDHCQHLAPWHQARCVKGPLLLKYLRNVSFTGITGNISFDHNGDILGRYEILNFQNDSSSPTGSNVTRVGIWDSSNRKLTINDSQVMWPTSPSTTPLLGPINHSAVPDSLGCGQHCAKGEIKSYVMNTCCWNCRSCARDEIPVDDATKCTKCPLLHWPDADFRRCEKIAHTYMRWHEPLALVIAGLSMIGLFLSGAILTIFARNNNARIIKATSRELSYIMLSGVFVQYMLVFTFISKPHRVLCVFNYIGFNVSFAIVYAALLTRTNRIYRIFDAGKRTKVMPSLTSPLSQVLIAVVLIAIQVIITILAMVFMPPGVIERMPVLLHPEVELACLLPVQGFVTSLSYNLLLVLICTWYAFKTRKLPDNFNESRCITLCVYTTLVIWLAFLPTFFTTSRAYYQVILISSALLLNATVTLLCLYVPRVCALRAERLGTSAGCMNNANTFKYTSQGPQLGVLIKDRLETGPVGAGDEQATELSDYGTGYS